MSGGGTVSVGEVSGVAEALAALHDLQARVYADLPAWHEPPHLFDAQRFDPESSFWRKHERVTLVARRGPERVGTMTVFWPKATDEARGGRQGRFGVFECLPDPEAAAALLAEGERRLVAAGCVAVRGPLYFSMHEEVGLLVEGHTAPPAIMMPFHPPAYAGYLEAAGFTPARAFHTLRYDLEQSLDVVTAFPPDGDGIRVRSFDKARLDEDARALLEVYNAAFAPNWGFTPLSERGCKALVEEFLLVGDPLLIRVAVAGERVVGFLLCLPDVNEYFHALRGWPDWLKMPLLATAILRGKLATAWPGVFSGLRVLRNCRVVTLAVHPDYQGRKISKRLVSSLAGEAIQVGYGNAELSYVDEGNQEMAGLMGGYEFAARKHFRLYEKALAAEGRP